MECSQEQKDCLQKASSILRIVPIKRPRQCEHVKINGEFCGSPALRGRNYCYFHLSYHGSRLRAERNHRRALADGGDTGMVPLELPPLEDAASIQMALMQVIDAILHNRIDSKRAGLVLYALQTAGSNLARADFEQQQGAMVAGRYDDFEEDFELGDDAPELSTDETQQARHDEEHATRMQMEQVVEACAKLEAAMQEPRITEKLEEMEDGTQVFRCDPLDALFCSGMGPLAQSRTPAAEQYLNERAAVSQRIRLAAEKRARKMPKRKAA